MEWRKRNGPPTSDAPPAPARAATSAPPAPASPPETPIEIECLGELRGLTTEDIASFKALGVEVRLKSEAYGDLWLVPAYTGQARKELTPEHAATVVRVLTAFPGSQVISFEKHSQPERPERLPRRP